MAWSYSGDPSSSPKDEVRFLVGDTLTADQQATDGEINYAIKLVYGNNPPSQGNYLPAAYVADAIGARYTRLVDKTVGDLSISYGQRAKQFADLSYRLRQRATLAGVTVFSGGNSRADKLAVITDPDFIGTAVRVDGMDYADPGPTTPGENDIP